MSYHIIKTRGKAMGIIIEKHTDNSSRQYVKGPALYYALALTGCRSTTLLK